jgi:hypothetical protein
LDTTAPAKLICGPARSVAERPSGVRNAAKSDTGHALRAALDQATAAYVTPTKEDAA